MPAAGVSSFSMATPDGPTARSRSVTPVTHHRILALQAQLEEQTLQHAAERLRLQEEAKNYAEEMRARYDVQISNLATQLRELQGLGGVTTGTQGTSSASAAPPSGSMADSFVDAEEVRSEQVGDFVVLTGDEE